MFCLIFRPVHTSVIIEGKCDKPGGVTTNERKVIRIVSELFCGE